MTAAEILDRIGALTQACGGRYSYDEVCSEVLARVLGGHPEVLGAVAEVLGRMEREAER